MKQVLFPAIAAVVLLSSAFTALPSSLWKVKEESYTVKMKCDKFEGVFKGLKSDISFDENNLGASKISASIDATSINTGNGMRNKHAKQGLSADQYATIKFESSSVTKKGDGYEASGRLTIKDVTKEIKMPFTFSKSADGGVFAGKFSLQPKDYHVDKQGTPETIEIELNVPVTK